jgi:hypothetical protein
MDTSHGEWFLECTLILVILVFLSSFVLATRQLQPDPEDQDIELGEFPSFVNPELVQERLAIPIPPDIDFPPAVHMGPSSDKHSASPGPTQELTNFNG